MAKMSVAASKGGWSLLRQRDFRSFLAARLCSNVAAQMQTVAVGWQVYSVTHDPLDLGLIGLSQFLPFVVLILPAGHVADTHDRRRILMGCYAAHALCALVFFFLALRGLGSPWPVFLTMSVLGIARAFAMPTTQALLPNLVTREQFRGAVAVNSSVFQASTIAGPTLGGLLFLAGAPLTYAVVAVLALASLLFVSRIRGGGRVSAVSEPTTLKELLSGLRFVWHKRTVLGAISLDLFAVLFGGATALLPVYARDFLHVGPTGLGLLRTAPGVGAVLCALALGVKPISRYFGRWMFGGVAMFGVAIIVFGLSRSMLLSLMALVLLGAGDMVSVYIRHLLVQLETPDSIRGRVSAVSAVFIGASNELGEFESGVAASWLGSVRAVVFGGVATLAVAAIWAKCFPALWSMDRLPAPNQDDRKSA